MSTLQTNKMQSLHLNNTFATGDEDRSNDNSQISQSTINLLAFLLLFYMFCITVWFIQSRYCSSYRRGPTYLSLLRQYLGSLFRTNRNIHYNYHNLPHYYNLDEREYKSWSVVEVASWSRSKLEDIRSSGSHRDVVASSYSVNNTGSEQYHPSSQEDDMILQQAIESLMQEQVDGESLDYITLEYMSRWMPFGIASRLMSQYNALISTYSGQEGGNRENSTKNLRADDELPSWYSDNQLHQADSNQRQDLKSQDSMSSENAQRLMRDRFGLSLPTLRTEEEVPTNAQAASALEMTPRTATIRERQTEKQAANISDGNSNSLDDILKAMPPHIRAVAERRPGMVAELLASRQQQHNVQKQEQLIPIHEEHSMDEVVEEVDFDSESASLLRRKMR